MLLVERAFMRSIPDCAVVSGVQVHDARLVASMKVNAISHILTLNVEDFKRYGSEGIVPVAPRTIGVETT